LGFPGLAAGVYDVGVDEVVLAEEVALVVEYVVDSGNDVGQVYDVVDPGKDVVACAGDGEVAVEKVSVEVDDGLSVFVIEIFEFASPKVVDDVYFVSFFYKTFGKIGANHTAAACYEVSFHDVGEFIFLTLQGINVLFRRILYFGVGKMFF
jgi:hypothetical protein